MQAVNRNKRDGGCLHKSVFTAALAGLALALICQVAPAPAAAMEETLNDFLRGPPFEFGSEELPPAGEAAQTEASNSDLSLSPPQITSTGPILEQIKEFAEAMRGDAYAPPGEAVAHYAFDPRPTPSLAIKFDQGQR